ncbi:MAG: hypothetical protein H7287_05085 [Thermoleophilia bacterium]|nr:hypothetical protein [Thermoleophilia bacterium]
MVNIGGLFVDQQAIARLTGTTTEHVANMARILPDTTVHLNPGGGTFVGGNLEQLVASVVPERAGAPFTPGERALVANALLQPHLSDLVPVDTVAARLGVPAHDLRSQMWEAGRFTSFQASGDGAAVELMPRGSIGSAHQGALLVADEATPAASKSSLLRPRNVAIGAGLAAVGVGTYALMHANATTPGAGNASSHALNAGTTSGSGGSVTSTSGAGVHSLPHVADARGATGPQSSNASGSAATYSGSDSIESAEQALAKLDSKSLDGKRAAVVVAALKAAKEAKPGTQSGGDFLTSTFQPIAPIGSGGAGFKDAADLVSWGEASNSLVSDVTRPAQAGDVLLLDTRGDDLKPDAFAIVTSVAGNSINVVQGGVSVAGANTTTIEQRTYAKTAGEIVGRLDPAAAEKIKPPVIEQAPPPAPAPPPVAQRGPGNFTPNQYNTFAAPNGATACSVVAAMGLARAAGKDPSAADAMAIALNHNYARGQGMMSGGSDSVVAMLADMGVGANASAGIDKARMIRSVQAGKPVVMATRGHFWVAEGYNPATDEFDFAASAAVLQRLPAKKTTWRLEEIGNMPYGAPIRNVYLNGQ